MPIMSLVKDLSEKIMQLVEKNPVYQSDLVRLLNVKHDQRIAEALRPLLDSYKISRTKVRYKKGQTFLIKLNGAHKVQKKSPYISNPCWGCECSIEKLKDCVLITNWAVNPR